MSKKINILTRVIGFAIILVAFILNYYYSKSLTVYRSMQFRNGKILEHISSIKDVIPYILIIVSTIVLKITLCTRRIEDKKRRFRISFYTNKIILLNGGILTVLFIAYGSNHSVKLPVIILGLTLLFIGELFSTKKQDR